MQNQLDPPTHIHNSVHKPVPKEPNPWWQLILMVLFVHIWNPPMSSLQMY